MPWPGHAPSAPHTKAFASTAASRPPSSAERARTQLCPQPQDGAPRPPSIGCTPFENGVVRFSAYRIHGSDDPLLFDAAPYAVTWRNGEPGHGGRAYAVNASSLALVYEW